MSHRSRLPEPRRNLDEQAAVPRENCATPHKKAYATRAAARRARKRAQKSGGKLSAYLCSCRNWHLGRLPPQVISGDVKRKTHR